MVTMMGVLRASLVRVVLVQWVLHVQMTRDDGGQDDNDDEE
jgi:hypothetical protein